jgi:hypothetical protein
MKLNPIKKNYYGDDVRWFLGTVINSHPPAGLEGRVKVRILGVHSESTTDIPESDLPWAQVLIPSTEGGISGIGRIPQLAAGAFVFGIFLDGTTSQIPLVIGSLPRVEKPSSLQSNRRVSSSNAFDYNQTRLQNVIAPRLKDDDLPEGDLDLRRQQCMKFFIDNGYELIHAAAITGALEGHSSFVTSVENQNADGPATVGIAKWKKIGTPGSRFNELLRFAREYQPPSSWKLYSIQLEFVLFELRNKFSLTNNKIISSTNIKDASAQVNSGYLKSTNRTDRIAQVAYDEVIT